MSDDIVERWRKIRGNVKFADPEVLCAVGDRMVAEIERLRQRVAELDIDYTEHSTYNMDRVRLRHLCQQKDAEIERLRESNAGWIDMVNRRDRLLKEERAEVARLRDAPESR